MKSKPPAKTKRRAKPKMGGKMRRMPKFPRIGEEMKQWSAMLGEELQRWPDVTSRAMFGMTGFHRGKKIFAALPATRGLVTANSIIFRIQPMPADLLQKAKEEPRINLEGRTPGHKWYVFEISSGADLRDALWWMHEAYERAK